MEEVMEAEVVAEDMRPQRKAPTVFAEDAAKKRSYKIQAIVTVVLLVIGLGASAAVGVTDDGQIDVARTIKERNDRMANMVDVDGPTVVAAPQFDPSVPDGGFVVVGQKPTPTPIPAPAATASSTATTTDTVASSTAEITLSEEMIEAIDASLVDTATTTVTATEAATTSSPQ